jgi:hypothetical protein
MAVVVTVGAMKVAAKTASARAKMVHVMVTIGATKVATPVPKCKKTTNHLKVLMHDFKDGFYVSKFRASG